MASIDCDQPNVEDEYDVSNNTHEIGRISCILPNSAEWIDRTNTFNRTTNIRQDIQLQLFELAWYAQGTLLIADERPDEDPNELNIYATQRLIKLYTVIVTRNFMIRLNALMKFLTIMKCLVVDWRITSGESSSKIVEVHIYTSWCG